MKRLNRILQIVLMGLVLLSSAAGMAEAKTVRLSWGASSDTAVTGYRVYYQVGDNTTPFTGTGATQGASPIDVGMTTSFDVTGLNDSDVQYFAVTAYDANGTESIYSNIVTAAATSPSPTNQPPVFDTINSKTGSEGALLSFTVNATDPEGATLTYAASGLPTGAAFSTTSHTFSWTPDYTQSGDYTVTFTASDGSLQATTTVAITVNDSNQAPTINGAPATSVMAGAAYSFTPTASDPDGDTLTFNITNKPTWATFNSASGQLSGTPAATDVGDTTGIIIGVSDGKTTASLPAFALAVTANPNLDSDGDGVIDSLDAFPQDPARSKFEITASASTGGYIAPSGVAEVAPGASQQYLITPATGYQIQDVLVDGQSVGAVESYSIDNVQSDRTITAQFSLQPQGLSVLPSDTGLPGLTRPDGGNDSNNLINGKPSFDVTYRFQIKLQDVSGTVDRVLLMLDGYPYEMQLTAGQLATGATYTLDLQLGPAPQHWYRFEARSSADAVLYRLPASGDWDGPVINLLDGVNQIGLPLDADGSQLTQSQAFGNLQTKAWDPSSGGYTTLKSTDPVHAGMSYFVKTSNTQSLPSLNQVPYINAATYDIPLQPGWNGIATPYGGQVRLADCLITKDNGTPASWTSAVDSTWVINGLYTYEGKGWGNGYSFSAAGGAPDAVLVPWRSYWIYLNKSDGSYVLTVPNPNH